MNNNFVILRRNDQIERRNEQDTDAIYRVKNVMTTLEMAKQTWATRAMNCHRISAELPQADGLTIGQAIDKVVSA